MREQLRSRPKRLCRAVPGLRTRQPASENRHRNLRGRARQPDRHRDGAAEQNHLSGRTITAEPRSLGVQFDGRWQTADDVVFVPQLRAAWLHDLNPDHDIARSFKELPSLLIWQTTLPSDTDAAWVELSGLWMAGRYWSIKASADVQVSGAYTTVGGTLGGSWSFGKHWSAGASVKAQTSSQYGATSGMLNVRYAW